MYETVDATAVRVMDCRLRDASSKSTVLDSESERHYSDRSLDARRLHRLREIPRSDPDTERGSSTSYIERQNLTMRMSMRR